MNPDELQKSIQILEKAEHVALLLPPETNADILASAEVLTGLLSSKGKRVGFLTAPNIENTIHPESYAALKAQSSLLKEFVISLDTAKSPASELRYERQPDHIDIIISPKQNPIVKEAISFRQGKTLCDCVLALGILDLETFDSAGIYDASLFTETPIINLDINPKNTRYGETNFVIPEKTSLAELVYDYLVAIYKEPLNATHATMLLSGIIQETDGFKSPRTNADTLLAASELTRLGASHHDAFTLARARVPLGLIQLFGRASVRSRIDQEHPIVWSFLTAEDFEKTGRFVKDIPDVLARLKSEFASESLCVLLWQEQENGAVAGIMNGTKRILDTLHSRIGGELDNTSLTMAGSYQSFKEAEETIGALLKEII